MARPSAAPAATSKAPTANPKASSPSSNSTTTNSSPSTKAANAKADKPVTFYSLDVIISVGYRVNSYKATQFRIWATKTLREYIIKGFVLDDERLKQGKKFGRDYFEELLERIREIRASERRFYQKITDLFAQCSPTTIQRGLYWLMGIV